MKKIFCFAILLSGILMAFSGNAQTLQSKVVNNYSLPQTMIRLCNLSYITDTTDRKKAVRDSVKNQLGLDVVWGPEELIESVSGISYSSMYVAKDPFADDYTVVIRGTNYESLKSWVGEDFQVRKAVKFRKFVRLAPKNACISKGTCIGMHDLMKLRDANNNGDVIDFLKQVLKTKKISNLYVTGHSLGGTLTPAFYTYLCYKLFGGPPPSTTNCSPFSFAGLTAGNEGFNNYLQTYLQKTQTNWRIVNPLDVAPNLWAGQDSVKAIYSNYGFPYGLPESLFLDYLFDRARPNNYQQPPASELRLPVVYNASQTSWVTQAEYQHHSTTYISLVDTCCSKK